ncbi:Uncharacterized protein OBRU01_07528 [Operophtera brumata]|uniref:Uncharacterized protein n=1 Tax=Operophtera brumata TaxID=104452 RepID=A0A0L7LJP2_OPEBR|nr:Uncharacterized protein OBRU01_07528 [Operophtera brumata]
MGKKRKHEKTEEEIRRKIQKLQNQLAQSSTRERSFSEENLNDLPLDTPCYGSPYCVSAMDTIQYEETSAYMRSPSPLPPIQPSPHPSSPQPPSPRVASLDNTQLPASTPGAPVPPNDNETGDAELDDEILQLLGDAPKAETPLGPPIHKDIARRWQDILAKGLSKDIKEGLLKDYMVPNNCDLLLAPTLTPEVKAALPDTLIKRDSSLVYKQKQLGIALSALATEK